MKTSDIVITSAKRTAIGSLNKSLRNVQSYDLCAAVIKDLLKETMLVYVSVLAGDFVLKQVAPAATELTTESTGAFTNDPNF